MSRPVIQIVTPSAARANNGNWRTAARWARLLSARYRVIVQSGWKPGSVDARADCLLALHARRSHPAVQEWRERSGSPLPRRRTHQYSWNQPTCALSQSGGLTVFKWGTWSCAGAR